MAKMFLMEVEKDGIKVEVNSLEDMYKFIDCDTVDSQGLFTVGEDRVVIWVDDEGLLKNKKRNRGFVGNILVGKVNFEGEDIDLQDEDIEKVIHMLQAPKVKSEMIEDFINSIDELIPDPIFETFSFDDINLVVTVSSNDVINSLSNLESKGSIDLIENFIGALYLGLIDTEDFFHQLLKCQADAIYKNTKEDYMFFKKH